MGIQSLLLLFTLNNPGRGEIAVSAFFIRSSRL